MGYGYGFKLRPASAYSGTAPDLPRNYDEAREAFERADRRRGGARGRIAHNTTLHQVEGAAGKWKGALSYVVRLHRTDILTFEPDGAVVLNSGGFQTFTTRDRMNRCGVRVGMSGGVPYVVHGGSSPPTWTACG